MRTPITKEHGNHVIVHIIPHQIELLHEVENSTGNQRHYGLNMAETAENLGYQNPFRRSQLRRIVGRTTIASHCSATLV